MKKVYYGIIQSDDKLVKLLLSSCPAKVMNAMDLWFCNYAIVKGIKFDDVPPLDDWSQSDENENTWSVDVVTYDQVKWKLILSSEWVEL